MKLKIKLDYDLRCDFLQTKSIANINCTGKKHPKQLDLKHSTNGDQKDDRVERDL